MMGGSPAQMAISVALPGLLQKPSPAYGSRFKTMISTKAHLWLFDNDRWRRHSMRRVTASKPPRPFRWSN